MTTQFDVQLSEISGGPAGCNTSSVMMEHGTGSNCRASAPPVSEITCEHPSTMLETTPCYCNSFFISVPEEVRKNIASYLSSGDSSALAITPQNVDIYRRFANEINHVAMQNLLDKKNGNCARKLSCRAQVNAPMFLVMFPTMHDGQKSRIQVLDVRTNKMDTVECKKITRFGDGFDSCTIYLKECPYILISGGNDKTRTTMGKYDVVENKWSKCCSLKSPRTKHRMVPIGVNVYIIGGKPSNSIERYDVIHNTCTEVASLPVHVHSFATATHGDFVFIFGGKTEAGDVACVQCLNTKTNTVHVLPDLPCKCSGGQAVAVRDRIYLATNHGHMIQFDPKSGHSKLCSRQPYRRKHFAMFPKGDKLCMFGGLWTEGPVENGASSSSSSLQYVYNPVDDSWTLESCYKEAVPVYSSCLVRYIKECPVKPFMKMFGYC